MADITTNDDWFQLFKEGNEQAFQKAFDRYYRKIRYYALKILKDDPYAEDVVSESFGKAWEARTKLATPKHLGNFLYLVTRNGCLTYLRNRRREKNREQEWTKSLGGECENVTPLDIERVQTEFMQAIFDKLPQLPGGDVLRMCYVEGKSTSEIAKELEITENNVYILKSRSIKALRRLLSTTVLLMFALLVLAQPLPAIDTNAIDTWPSLFVTPSISACGNYVAYTQYVKGSRTVIIGAVHGGWEKEFTGAGPVYFSGDERAAVVPIGDSLYFVRPGTGSVRALPVLSYQWPFAGDGRWLAYREKPSGRLELADLLKDAWKDLGECSVYQFDPQGRVLVSGDRSRLRYMELQSGDTGTIWAGRAEDTLGQICWDREGRHLAFVVKRKRNAIGYWRSGGGKARIILDADRVTGPMAFSANGKWLFFYLSSVPKAPRYSAYPIIWNSKDRNLADVEEPTSFLAAMAVNGTEIRQLEDSDQYILTPPNLVTGDHVFVRRSDGFWLLSLTDGALERVTTAGIPENFSFSPNGQWFIYYDNVKGQYFTYEFATERLRAITSGLPHSVSSEFPRGVAAQAVADPAGWLGGDSEVLIYDNYDLWAIDPRGRRPSFNITHGYGYAHGIKLRLTTEIADTLLFTGFNVRNKYNGFFREMLGQRSNPECLFMGPYTFYRVESQKPHRYSFDDGMRPVKAARANRWIVKRESAREAPNYYLTADFRQYEPITHLAPQTRYNWLTAELIRYTQADGSPGQGILYKPENFDPAKRYPVIFTIYEQLSHRLYEFPRPDLCRDNIDVPWFVSRGYLVFTSDIHYRPANSSNKTVGEWALSSVLPAVRYLAKLPYVDGKRLGIQGHSLGAEETNYIIAHTRVFAAAVEMAGATDPVSAYLTLLPDGDHPFEYRESQYIWEAGQARMGATLWQRPDLYLRESAVLNADKIGTPLLIVHNNEDAAVQGRQGVELFMALRRLHKPVWMLQYPGENHSFFRRDAAIDYTLRLTAFFDHFLKGEPLPGWMQATR